MSKAQIDFAGFEEMRAKLNALGADTKQIAVDALKATNEIVVKMAEQGMQKSNLPAKGEYSQGQTESALRHEPIIEENGTEIIAHIGFDIKKGGLPSVFLMYGTPYMTPDRVLYDAFFGQDGEIAAAQKKVFDEALERIML